MRKFYLLFVAMVLSLTANAQTTASDLEGAWTFTVMDESGTPSTLNVTAITEGADDLYAALTCNVIFKIDGVDYFIAGQLLQHSSSSTGYFLRFPQWIQEGKVGPNPSNWLEMKTLRDESNDNNTYTVYDPEKGEFGETFNQFFFNKYALKFRFTEYTDRNYSSGADIVKEFTIISARKGGAAAEPSIIISLPEGSYSGGYETQETAKVTATAVVTAENVDDFKVYSSLLLDDKSVVEDPLEVKADSEGKYTATFGGLDFEKNYTIYFWAEAGDDYQTVPISQIIWTGEAPGIRVTATVDEANVTENSAQVDVTFVPYVLADDLEYTVSATSGSGVDVAGVSATGTTATLNIASLNDDTEYTYTVKVSTKDANGIEFEGVRDVTFKTLAGTYTPAEPGEYTVYGPEQGTAKAGEILKTNGTAVVVSTFFNATSQKSVAKDAKFADGVLGTDLCQKTTNMRLKETPTADVVKGTPNSDGCTSFDVVVKEPVSEMKIYFEASGDSRNIYLYDWSTNKEITITGVTEGVAMGGTNNGFVATATDVQPGAYTLYSRGFGGGFMGIIYKIEQAVEAPAAPVFKPEDGATVAKLQNIEITAEEGCDIYWMIKGWYEEDGFLKLSAPDAFDETAVPLNYTGSTITYVAYAEKDGVKSEEATATYTIGKNAPTFFWSVEETGAPVEEWTYNLNDEEATLPLLIGDLGEAEVTVESSNEAVAVFDVENWTINVKAAGETTLTATLPETTMYTAATATLKLTVTESSIETGEHTYDFTKWSDATIAALAAANDVWSDDEKGDGTNVTDGNCYWLVKGADNNSGKNRDLEDAVDEDGNLLANGEVIEELKGLDFSVIGKKRSLAIAVNYPSTSLGNYEGGSYLWLGGKDINYFVIKDVKAGSFVKMGVESHKTEEARGVELSVYDETADNLRGEKLLGADGKEVAAPTVFEEQVWQVPGEEGTVDILVYNTNGCHIYYIDLADDAEVTTEPEAVLATAEVENVTDTTADIVATFTTANLPEGAKVKVIATEAETRTNTEVEAGEGTATIALTGLTAETEYNYMVVVQVDDAEGNILVRSNIVYLTFTTTASGITGINADAEGVRYFNINGVEVKNPAAGSVYLKVTGNKVEKVLVK